MNPNDRTVVSKLPSTPSARVLLFTVLALICAACGSDTDTDSGSAPGATTAGAGTTSPEETTEPEPPVLSDQELAEAALLTPDDLDGGFRDTGDEGDWPYSVEIAEQAPPCVPFAEDVFGGGAHHAPSATVTLARQENYLFTNVFVFPTVDDAATLMNVVKSSEFDDCWEQYMGVAVLAWPAGVSEAHYAKADPPHLTLDADDSVTRKVAGTVVIDGAESGDSCVCVFSRVGRAVVLVHSSAEQFDDEERTAMTQTAIDKARELIG